ncbi:MAG: ribonuclease HI family protein [Candidatus Jordarchaeales archaeon]
MVKVFVDGASRGNPGPAGIGFVIIDSGGRILERRGRYVGVATNNQAEYLALIEALEACIKAGASRVEVFSDSELLVKQMKGEYRVRNPHLIALHRKARELEKLFNDVTYHHIPREANLQADKLANEAIDRGALEFRKSNMG